MIKTENQIWADLRKLITLGLAKFGIEGWQIRQLQQPVKITTLQPTVFMAKLNAPRIGCQYSKKEVVDGSLMRTEKFIQEIRFQISALKKRIPAVVDDFTSSDALNALISWFMSRDGLSAIRALGYNTYRVGRLEEPFFIDDSDTYERNPYFEFSLIVNQSYSEEIPGTNQLIPKITGV